MGDLYKKIMSDKGSTKQGTVNLPLSEYLVNRKEKIEFLSTNVIALNLLFSGRVSGGIPKGRISMISAPSMLGKSLVAMSIIKSAQKDGMDVVVIDTERAFSFKTAESMGIDTSPEKLIIFEENSIEEVETMLLKIVDGVPRDKRKNILVVVDSWGTLVTSKSLQDGLIGKDVKDMTLSQKKNQLANVILNTKCTYFVVNHVYDNTGGFGDPMKIPGGRRIMFNSDTVLLCMSRAKDKDKTTKMLLGHIVGGQTYKSRHCLERSELKFRIKHDGGLDVFYGIKDAAIDGGYIVTGKRLDEKESKKKGVDVFKNVPGTFMRSHIENDTPVKEHMIYNKTFWMPIFKDTDFKKYLETKYTFNSSFDIVNNETELIELNDVDGKEE